MASNFPREIAMTWTSYRMVRQSGCPKRENSISASQKLNNHSISPVVGTAWILSLDIGLRVIASPPVSRARSPRHDGYTDALTRQAQFLQALLEGLEILLLRAMKACMKVVMGHESWVNVGKTLSAGVPGANPEVTKLRGSVVGRSPSRSRLLGYCFLSCDEPTEGTIVHCATDPLIAIAPP